MSKQKNNFLQIVNYPEVCDLMSFRITMSKMTLSVCVCPIVEIDEFYALCYVVMCWKIWFNQV